MRAAFVFTVLVVCSVQGMPGDIIDDDMLLDDPPIHIQKRSTDKTLQCVGQNLGSIDGCTFYEYSEKCKAIAKGSVEGTQVEQYMCGSDSCYCTSQCYLSGPSDCSDLTGWTLDKSFSTRCNTNWCGDVGSYYLKYVKGDTKPLYCRKQCCCPCFGKGVGGGKSKCTDDNGLVPVANKEREIRCYHIKLKL